MKVFQTGDTVYFYSRHLNCICEAKLIEVYRPTDALIDGYHSVTDSTVCYNAPSWVFLESVSHSLEVIRKRTFIEHLKQGL